MESLVLPQNRTIVKSPVVRPHPRRFVDSQILTVRRKGQLAADDAGEAKMHGAKPHREPGGVPQEQFASGVTCAEDVRLPGSERKTDDPVPMPPEFAALFLFGQVPQP